MRMKTKSDTYVCDLCGKTYSKVGSWTDKDAEMEYMRLFGAVPPESDLAILCDDCWKIVRPQEQN